MPPAEKKKLLQKRITNLTVRDTIKNPIHFWIQFAILLSQYETLATSSVCPGSSDPFYIVTYYIKWVTTSWTYCIMRRCDFFAEISEFFQDL